MRHLSCRRTKLRRRRWSCWQALCPTTRLSSVLRITRRTRVRLELMLERNESATFSAVVTTSSGEVVYDVREISAQDRDRVDFDVPIERLKPGVFQISLKRNAMTKRARWELTTFEHINEIDWSASVPLAFAFASERASETLALQSMNRLLHPAFSALEKVDQDELRKV